MATSNYIASMIPWFNNHMLIIRFLEFCARPEVKTTSNLKFSYGNLHVKFGIFGPELSLHVGIYIYINKVRTI